MLPLRRAMRRRLLAAVVISVTAFAPLTVQASSAPDVNALWNEPDGVRVDSGLYVVQVWLNSFTQQIETDPTQRGLDELSQANQDLLNAHTLLQEQHDSPGPQPVALIDPLISSIYNALTGSNISAPLGSLFDSMNKSLLKFEGRGGTSDIVRGLLQDYRVKQAVALRDLNQKPSADMDGLLRANAQREREWLGRINAVATPGEGLTDLLNKADQSTAALASHGKSDASHGKAGSPGNGNGQSTKIAKPKKK
jgi:hypothetical protein